MQKIFLLLGLIYTWIQILGSISDLIHYNNAEHLLSTGHLSSTNGEDKKMVILNHLENGETEKVKYEGRRKGGENLEEVVVPLLKRY